MNPSTHPNAERRSDRIDLRSDTVTLPTPAMREAMAHAPVGDDVFGEDPTVTELERATAALLGKEAALFVPSGTMANQIAIRTHTEPGQEILMDANAHIYFYEAGATAALSGVICRCLPGRLGIFSPDDIEAVLRPRDVHFAPTRLVCVENTHNRGGGTVWSLGQTADVAQCARQHELKLHLDGARLWNAACAAGTSEKEYAAHFDSISVCFSKGLGAPVGSALAGSSEFIHRARRFRKQFGGGMRQSGIIAAGALYALEHHRERLIEDHANARRLADGLAGIEGVEIGIGSVQTNIVRIHLKDRDASATVRALGAAGVLALATGPDVVRCVTSLMVDADAIDRAVRAFRQVLEA